MGKYKTSSVLYATPKVSIVFTTGHQWSLPLARCTQRRQCHILLHHTTTNINSIHLLRLGLPCNLLFSKYPTETLEAPTLPTRVTLYT